MQQCINLKEIKMSQDDTFNSLFFSNTKDGKNLICKAAIIVNKNLPKNVVACGAPAEIIKN
jgi:acetyltransferase-like isoleucine patch superfamily enzyme